MLKPKFITGAVVSTVLLIGLMVEFVQYRRAEANTRQLIGTWKLVSGGWGGTQTIDFHDNGTLTSTTRSFGKTSKFDGTYSVGSRSITMTVLANHRSQMEWDPNSAEWEKWTQESAAAMKNAAKAQAESVEEDPELEDAPMSLVSFTAKELVIADRDGRRTIYNKQ